MELFKLFGSILVDNDEANKSIAKTDDKAKKTGGTFKSMIGTVGKWGLAVGAAAGTAAIAIGVTAFNAAEDLKGSLNDLQASTGATTKEIDEMKKSMLDIYKNNFGESFDDIGNSMAIIRQQTNLSGDALKDFTQNALMIRDTFGIEVSESVRSVNQLMKNFGIDSEEAYNLMAQGAQWGLNANENLADSINEYSVHFAQLGLNAEDMFNALASGASSGVFDIDKLGDAVKEFGIRTKDGSKASIEAFEILGLNAQQLTADFAAGGEAGKLAFETVTDKINNLQDPVAQTQVGVALFGTMWEDVGAKGIAALTDWEVGIDSATNALEQINAVKYDTFTEAMTGIGRQIQVGMLIPLGEKMLPLLNIFANWIQRNMPIIEEAVRVAFVFMGEIFEKVQKFIKEKIMPAFTELSDNVTIDMITIKETIDIYIKYITETILPLLVEYLKFIYEEILPILIATFKEYFPIIADIVKTVVEIITRRIKILVDVFLWAFPYIKKIVVPIIKYLIDQIGGFIKILQGVLNFIEGVFTADWERAWKGIQQIFEGIWTRIKFFIEPIIDWIADKVSWALEKINTLQNLAKKAGNLVSTGFNKVTSAVGFRAEGGSVDAGSPYIVGEKGAELFVPSQSGTIIPNNKINASGGTTVNVNITGNSIMDSRDADKFGDLIVGRLRMLGV